MNTLILLQVSKCEMDLLGLKLNSSVGSIDSKKMTRLMTKNKVSNHTTSGGDK